MTPRKLHFTTLRNDNGGWYQHGRVFALPKRLDIGYQYLDMCFGMWPERPSQRQLLSFSKISVSAARKSIMKLENTGLLIDREHANSEKTRDREKIDYLEPTKELFLLAIRAEKPVRPNRDYIANLATYYGTSVSSTFISEWFKTRFDHKGSFRKPNLVPLDKFRCENVIRFVEYKLKCQLLFDHSKFCFIDEKHLVNSDSVPKKLCSCPISGRTEFIPVSGDFCETYNLIACIPVGIL
jgi:hypothetical protein